MASYSMSSELSPSDVVNRALIFFGRGHRHLWVSVQGNRCVRFSNHGYVQVSAREDGNKTIVDLETSLWDKHVRQFMVTLAIAAEADRGRVGEKAVARQPATEG